MHNKIFRGWWVLAGLFLIYAATNGIVTLSLPRFYPKLIEIFGWSEAQVSEPASVFYLILALLCPFVGALLDRYRPRIVMIVGMVLLIAGLAGLGTIHSLSQFFVVYIIMAVGLAGTGLISCMYVLTQWFNQYRGLAIGILLIASSLGGAIFTKLSGTMIESYGWRNALFALAAICALLSIIPFLFWVRAPKPRELSSDSPSPVAAEKRKKPAAGITLGEAVKTPTFYLVFLTTSILWFCIIGLTQHQSIYLEKDLNFPAGIVTNVISTFFIFGIAGKLFFGYLSDRFDKKKVMLFSIICLIIGTFFLWLLGKKPGLISPYFYAITYGIAFSGIFTMIQVVVAHLYHGRSYGKILGVITTVDTLASVAGIFFLGKMRTLHGSYSLPLAIMIGLCIIAAIGVYFIKMPKIETC